MQDYHYKEIVKGFLSWTTEIRLNIEVPVVVRKLPARNPTSFTGNIKQDAYSICGRRNRVATFVLSIKLMNAFPWEKEMVYYSVLAKLMKIFFSFSFKLNGFGHR